MGETEVIEESRQISQSYEPRRCQAAVDIAGLGHVQCQSTHNHHPPESLRSLMFSSRPMHFAEVEPGLLIKWTNDWRVNPT